MQSNHSAYLVFICSINSAKLNLCYLQDTLVKHVDINIAESEKRANRPLHVRDHYTVYLIDVK